MSSGAGGSGSGAAGDASGQGGMGATATSPGGVGIGDPSGAPAGTSTSIGPGDATGFGATNTGDSVSVSNNAPAPGPAAAAAGLAATDASTPGGIGNYGTSGSPSSTSSFGYANPGVSPSAGGVSTTAAGGGAGPSTGIGGGGPGTGGVTTAGNFGGQAGLNSEAAALQIQNIINNRARGAQGISPGSANAVAGPLGVGRNGALANVNASATPAQTNPALVAQINVLMNKLKAQENQFGGMPRGPNQIGSPFGFTAPQLTMNSNTVQNLMRSQNTPPVPTFGVAGATPMGFPALAPGMSSGLQGGLGSGLGSLGIGNQGLGSVASQSQSPSVASPQAIQTALMGLASSPSPAQPATPTLGPPSPPTISNPASPGVGSQQAAPSLAQAPPSIQSIMSSTPALAALFGQRGSGDPYYGGTL